jgi:hypothetical protein
VTVKVTPYNAQGQPGNTLSTIVTVLKCDFPPIG